MAETLTDDGATEHWEILEFTPEGDKLRKYTKEANALRAARKSEWNPVINHVMTMTVTELIPVSTPPGSASS